MNFNFNSDQWASMFKGALVAAVGAGATWLLQNVGGFDFGTYTPLVVGVLSVVANYVRKVLGVGETPSA